jgi:hypothetical protein
MVFLMVGSICSPNGWKGVNSTSISPEFGILVLSRLPTASCLFLHHYSLDSRNVSTFPHFLRAISDSEALYTIVGCYFSSVLVCLALRVFGRHLVQDSIIRLWHCVAPFHLPSDTCSFCILYKQGLECSTHGCWGCFDWFGRRYSARVVLVVMLCLLTPQSLFSLSSFTKYHCYYRHTFTWVHVGGFLVFASAFSVEILSIEYQRYPLGRVEVSFTPWTMYCAAGWRHLGVTMSLRQWSRVNQSPLL